MQTDPSVPRRSLKLVPWSVSHRATGRHVLPGVQRRAGLLAG